MVKIFETIKENVTDAIEKRIDQPGPMKVEIVDIHVPFWSVVWLLIKVAIAAIPAALLILFFSSFYSVALVGILSGL
ncbi:MAG: hypothetical protein JRJ54_13685 [Deltaproteobacteria bacterium]|nr:hypothetical protein [Deltaproteobacteria bacterium]